VPLARQLNVTAVSLIGVLPLRSIFVPRHGSAYDYALPNVTVVQVMAAPSPSIRPMSSMWMPERPGPSTHGSMGWRRGGRLIIPPLPQRGGRRGPLLAARSGRDPRLQL